MVRNIYQISRFFFAVSLQLTTMLQHCFPYGIMESRCLVNVAFYRTNFAPKPLHVSNTPLERCCRCVTIFHCACLYELSRLPCFRVLSARHIFVSKAAVIPRLLGSWVGAPMTSACCHSLQRVEKHFSAERSDMNTGWSRKHSGNSETTRVGVTCWFGGNIGRVIVFHV